MKKTFVPIRHDLEKEDDTIIALRIMNQIKEDHRTCGVYDVVTKVNSDDAESLRETMIWKIPKLLSIRTILTIVAVKGQH